MKKQIIWNRQTLKLAWILPVLAALLAASLFARAADSQVAHIGGYEEGQSFSLYWIDNHNQEGDRPTASTDPAAAAALQPRLSFVLDGKEENPYRLWEYEGEMLSQALALVGLDEVPQAAVDTAGGMDVNSYTVSFGDSALPSLVYYEGEWDPDANDGAGGPATDPETGEPYPGHTVTWTVEPAEVADYNVVNVTEDTADQYPSAANGPGWYYVQRTEFIFTISLRWGTLDELEGVRAAILSHFSLNVLAAGGEVLSETLLDALDEGALSIAYYRDGEPIGSDDDVDPAMDDPDTAVFTVSGGWKYNLDGSLLTYRVEEIAEDGAAGPDQILHAGGLEKGDYFAVSYDNSASAGHGSADGAAYDGGTIYLTLTGATDYSATKVWLEPEGFSAEGRPGLEFHLYRYREGTDYTSAAPVRDEDDQPVVLTVGNGVVYRADDPDTADISYWLDEDLLATLPKYDSEGYRYLYVVREVMTGGSQAYEQVFGTVVDGAVVEDEDRQSGDTYLYDEGTLLNRISDTVTTSVTKVWNASAFQSGFEDVSVELTLQVREKGSSDPWETATDSSGSEIVRTMEGFTSETLSGTTLEVSVPRYGGTGVELEYRWVETGVTQGSVATAFSPGPDGGTASFQLQVSYNGGAWEDYGDAETGDFTYNEATCDFTVEKNVNALFRVVVTGEVLYGTSDVTFEATSSTIA